MKNQEYTLYSHYYDIDTEDVTATHEVFTDSVNGQRITGVSEIKN